MKGIIIKSAIIKRKAMPLGTMRLNALLVLLAVTCSGSVLATNSTLIRDLTIFDATGQAPYTADVLIQHGRFQAIGTHLNAPADAQIIAGKGLSMLPGLIDVHVHWTNMGGVSRADIASQLLLSGVTTVTDFHSAPESYAPKRDYHQQLLSPHVIYTARTGVPGGHGTDWGDETITRLATSEQEANAAITQLQQYQPDMIKVFADGWRYGNPVNRNSINPNALAAVVTAARERNLPVVTHTVTVNGAKLAATAGVTAIVHAIQDREADDELVALLQKNQVYYAPTLAVYEPRPGRSANTNAAQDHLTTLRQAASRKNLQRFAKAGIAIALGTDAGINSTFFGESSLRELELLVEFGLTPAEALIAGTANSAAVLGLQQDRGTIETGKRADFVLIKGSPWQNISDYRQNEYVFVDGKMLVKQGQLTAPQGPALPKTTAAPAVLDDFERADNLTLTLASRQADLDFGFPRSQLLTQRVPRDSGGMALFLSAKMAIKEAPKALIVLPTSPGAFAPVNTTGFNGVQFEVRGDSQQYLVELVSTTGVVSKTFHATQHWQQLQLAFSDFSATANNAQFSAENVIAVKVGAQRAAGETFWLELDNVGFY